MKQVIYRKRFLNREMKDTDDYKQNKKITQNFCFSLKNYAIFYTMCI